MNAEEVRRIALALPRVTEEPHHHFTSFRIKGMIFATMPPEGDYLHIFVDDPERELMASSEPETYEKLWWGKKVVGLRCRLSAVDSQEVGELLHLAWQRKAPNDIPRKILPAMPWEDE